MTPPDCPDGLKSRGRRRMRSRRRKRQRRTRRRRRRWMRGRGRQMLANQTSTEADESDMSSTERRSIVRATRRKDPETNVARSSSCCRLIGHTCEIRNISLPPLPPPPPPAGKNHFATRTRANCSLWCVFLFSVFSFRL